MFAFHEYTLLQWAVFFMFYAVFGWIFECVYCSLKSGRLLNRGFCHGPWIPLYGFGATLLVLLSWPYREQHWAVFLLGFLGGSALELLTGVLLNRIFHMRWWDYSHNILNFHGYTSLFSSIGWGMLALVITEWIHPRVEHISMHWSYTTFLVVNTMLYTLFVEDVIASFAAALELRERIERIAANSEEIERLRASIQEIYSRLGEARADLNASKEAILSIRKSEGNLAAAKYVATETLQTTRNMTAGTVQAAKTATSGTVHRAKAVTVSAAEKARAARELSIQTAKSGIDNLTRDTKRRLLLQKMQLENWLVILQEGGNEKIGRMGWWTRTMLQNTPELLPKDDTAEEHPEKAQDERIPEG